MDALLVIDIQKACVGDQHAKIFKYDSGLIGKINDVISKYEKDKVYYIKNLMKDNFINMFAPAKFYEGTEETEFSDGLSVVSKNIFSKYKGNAFTNPKLAEVLKENGIKSIEIIGVDSACCVAKTAEGAVKEGFSAAVNQSAIATIFQKKLVKIRDKLMKIGVRFI